jgi:hypothetical protein
VPDRGLPARSAGAQVPEHGSESDHDVSAVEPLAAGAEPVGTEAQPDAGHSAKTTANGHLATPPTRHGLAGQPEDASVDPAAQQVAPTDIEPRRIPEAERMVPSSQAQPEPLSQQPRSEQAGRAGRSDSPIFEEMASAWFRENLEFDQDRDSPSPGAGATAWSAGEPLLRPMPEPGESAELTPAGLPKRRPRSQLIPGSAGGADSTPAGVPVRSPEQVRGRLASYQQGVRQGRASRHRRSDTAGEHSAPENHWEEKP